MRVGRESVKKATNKMAEVACMHPRQAPSAPQTWSIQERATARRRALHMAYDIVNRSTVR